MVEQRFKQKSLEREHRSNICYLYYEWETYFILKYVLCISNHLYQWYVHTFAQWYLFTLLPNNLCSYFYPMSSINTLVQWYFHTFIQHYPNCSVKWNYSLISWEQINKHPGLNVSLSIEFLHFCILVNDVLLNEFI
jgi:hypothetical protein